MIEQWNQSTSCHAANSLIGNIEETLISMKPCPKKRRLERIHSGLKREQETLEKAVRQCDAIKERRALYQIASKIARYYRTLGTDGLG